MQRKSNSKKAKNNKQKIWLKANKELKNYY